MKTYEPNESPAIKDVEIGVPIFYMKRMRWIIPTKTAIDSQVWWRCKTGEEIWSALENFTFNPVIPEPPKQKRKTRLYLWKYIVTGEYAAHQFPPDRDQEKDIKVVNRFDWEVEE